MDKMAAKNEADSMVADRIDRWVKESVNLGRRLGYETARGKETLPPS
jgi:hypothetical protein